MVRLAPVAILSFINMIVDSGAAQPATTYSSSRPGHSKTDPVTS